MKETFFNNRIEFWIFGWLVAFFVVIKLIAELRIGAYI